MRRAALALALAGCATGGVVVSPCDGSGPPYVTERPTVPFEITPGNMSRVWFADGAPTVLTVHNPGRAQRLIHVTCNPSVEWNYIDRGHIEGWFCVPGREEASRLVEFMNVDALRRDTCEVAEFYPDEDCSPGEVGGDQ